MDIFALVAKIQKPLTHLKGFACNPHNDAIQRHEYKSFALIGLTPGRHSV